MIIFDNHVHLRNDAIDFFLGKFKRNGGTALNLVNLTDDCFTVEDFEKRYRETEEIASILRTQDLEVVVTVGPYPVNIVSMVKYRDMDECLNLYKRAVDIALREVLEGRANAIGEVGRPHFPVGEEIIESSNKIISYIFSITSDNNVPVILHTESLDSKGMCDIMKMAENNGKRERVVKHFSQPIFSDNCGITPSVPANRRNARIAPWGKRGFFLETDFAGDIKNPNFVLPADSVPGRVRMLMQEGVDEDKIETSMEYYRQFYNIE